MIDQKSTNKGRLSTDTSAPKPREFIQFDAKKEKISINQKLNLEDDDSQMSNM